MQLSGSFLKCNGSRSPWIRRILLARLFLENSVTYWTAKKTVRSNHVVTQVEDSFGQLSVLHGSGWLVAKPRGVSDQSAT